MNIHDSCHFELGVLVALKHVFMEMVYIYIGTKDVKHHHHHHHHHRAAGSDLQSQPFG